jgi:NAD dependent epimerase/dehydratase family enzyme
MNKAYFFPPVPEVLMKLAVGWELGESLGLNSIRAIPKKLLGAGFVFDFSYS